MKLKIRSTSMVLVVGMLVKVITFDRKARPFLPNELTFWNDFRNATTPP